MNVSIDTVTFSIAFLNSILVCGTRWKVFLEGRIFRLGLFVIGCFDSIYSTRQLPMIIARNLKLCDGNRDWSVNTVLFCFSLVMARLNWNLSD